MLRKWLQPFSLWEILSIYLEGKQTVCGFLRKSIRKATTEREVYIFEEEDEGDAEGSNPFQTF